MMFLCQCHDGIHVACHTRIMDDDDDLCTLIDEWTDGVDSDIRIRCPTVGKYHFCTLSEEGDGGRHEGIGRHDHLVARFQVAEHGTHLQRIGTRSRQQAFLETITLLEERMTSFGEITISRHGHRAAYLFDIIEFTS